MLRSVLSALLLQHCGLRLPCQHGSSSSSGGGGGEPIIPRLEALLAFQPTGDSPIENLSAFEAEALQLAEILAEAKTKCQTGILHDDHAAGVASGAGATMIEKTAPCFVVIDEFGRGTSAKEAACYAVTK